MRVTGLTAERLPPEDEVGEEFHAYQIGPLSCDGRGDAAVPERRCEVGPGGPGRGEPGHAGGPVTDIEKDPAVRTGPPRPRGGGSRFAGRRGW